MSTILGRHAKDNQLPWQLIMINKLEDWNGLWFVCILFVLDHLVGEIIITNFDIDSQLQLCRHLNDMKYFLGRPNHGNVYRVIHKLRLTNWENSFESLLNTIDQGRSENWLQFKIYLPYLSFTKLCVSKSKSHSILLISSTFVRTLCVFFVFFAASSDFQLKSDKNYFFFNFSFHSCIKGLNNYFSRIAI